METPEQLWAEGMKQLQATADRLTAKVVTVALYQVGEQKLHNKELIQLLIEIYPEKTNLELMDLSLQYQAQYEYYQNLRGAKDAV